MADPFMAEIRVFSFTFAPNGWAQCNGQLMPISQNSALFSLLGTSYGGDGRTTFALPGLQGQLPMCWGQGPGLTQRTLGETGGSQSVALLAAEAPAHTHSLTLFSASTAVSSTPQDQYLADGACKPFGSTNLTTDTMLHPSAMTVAGGSQAHNNMMPSLAINFCIALSGMFPQHP
jgi:microcystin-dependent protein